MKKTLLVGLTLGLLLSGCDKDDSLNNIDGGGVRLRIWWKAVLQILLGKLEMKSVCTCKQMQLPDIRTLM